MTTTLFLFRRWMAAVLLLVMAGSAAAQPANTREYVLGPGDVIRITVFQSPDLSLETRVSESGTITYPLLGQVQVGGITVVQAEKRIADGLRSGNYVKQPQVSIMVVQVRGNQASVLGQVNRPGKYPLELANTRLTDLIAMAGGVAPAGADVVVVTGTRNGKPFRKEVNLPSIFMEGRTDDDMVMENGDVVYVDRMPTIYIYGEVQRPGAIRLERDMTVMQALATGGGLTQRGTERGLRVHRRGPDGKVQVIQPSMEDKLRDGDVVYVRESLF
ncbi:polysaccharide export protein EpsE [Caldimonas thermodepolymerans]|jgi:polysaccharide export outer membrane protein|uniref:Polysaccharide export outer membrane protein n=1 Tax=Caldimonas thermodepolymerans TaxID=215580 RepID=A0A2S5T8L7_9BURK|nr:polysaccharide export protein EpsE [Caldimonas thermodepolymerans]PPE71354.1 polysaccharide export protein EpsE [Caldimonas thermodepolymerans]QPC32528.1 polysaccharide export protein EpsE [Caldimonas thermodepolymerans]RDH98924.1 polysaccharide export outer membrane protein [Caldimonas thermodepolymerans]TCP06322.1 polysaccharide export outer membrane protein [Caldimonas thermodepolymerans]UZG45327.1 polysaccharide export protein EpsE [Caldimonas thermodepolymerans]